MRRIEKTTISFGLSGAFLLFALGGCSESTASDNKLDQPTLCDGSSAVRFSVSSGGGMVEGSYDFLFPYGWDYLFVDGTCRYFVSDGSGPIRSGKIEEGLAFEMEASLAYKTLADYVSDSESCADAGGLEIATVDARVSCSCACKREDTLALFDRANEYRKRLWDEGTESDVALSAVRDDVSTSAEPVAWPLSWPITELEPYRSKSGEKNLIGTDIPKAEDRESLRVLRDGWNAGKTYAGAIAVTSETVVYDLLVRDELPTDVSDAVDVFEALSRETD